jgi:NAD(P)-dependent dehydrogenase (short-subunit alcohol dehydrogenase family)
MAGLCEGRIVVVTGGARGLGREHCLLFAKEGAKVVVNDLGGSVSGEGANLSAAQQVVKEITDAGGKAVANGDDISTWDGAQRLIQQTVDTYGGLDVLVNNAGILRDRMTVNMTMEEWDAVIKVHLTGTFCPTRHAAEYWRLNAKNGGVNDGRIINTTSVSGLYGNAGQLNYAAAKAGIAAMTIVLSRELTRLNVTCNAISPGAFTRMTENIIQQRELKPGQFDTQAPANVSPMVVWLGSKESKDVTGRVFETMNGGFGTYNGWERAAREKFDHILEPNEMGPIVERLLEKTHPLQKI